MAPSHQYPMHTVSRSADTPQILRRTCRVSGEYRQLRTLTPSPGTSDYRAGWIAGLLHKALAETVITSLQRFSYRQSSLCLIRPMEEVLSGPAKKNVHIVGFINPGQTKRLLRF